MWRLLLLATVLVVFTWCHNEMGAFTKFLLFFSKFSCFFPNVIFFFFLEFGLVSPVMEQTISIVVVRRILVVLFVTSFWGVINGGTLHYPQINYGVVRMEWCWLWSRLLQFPEMCMSINIRDAGQITKLLIKWRGLVCIHFRKYCGSRL